MEIKTNTKDTFHESSEQTESHEAKPKGRLEAIRAFFHGTATRILGHKQEKKNPNKVPKAEWANMTPRQKHMAELWLDYKDPTPEQELAQIHARISDVQEGKPVLNKTPVLTVHEGGRKERKPHKGNTQISAQDHVA